MWQGTLTLPTYEEGKPDPNPPFDIFETSRFNYPYTLRENLTNHREEHAWRARVSRKRVSEMFRAARYRRTSLHVHRQAQRAVDVLCQSVDQEGAHRLSRSVGGIRHRVQFPGFAQLGFDVSGGFLLREAWRRQRIGDGQQRGSCLWNAVDGGIGAAAQVHGS